MNAQRLQTFKWLLNMRVERVRTDYTDGFIGKEEYSNQVAELLGMIITKFTGRDEVIELSAIFTKDEVISAFGLEEQHA